jgi:uncharacterized protein (TIGR02118 family)
MTTPAGIVRMGMIKRLPALTPEEFSKHWRGPHGTFGAAIPNLIRYHQNHTVRRFEVGGVPDPWNLDGFSELWFDDLPTMSRSIASPAYGALASDTPTVMTMPGLIAGPQEETVAGPDDPSRPKLMLIVGRRDDDAAPAFLDTWRQLSGDLRSVPGLLALRNTIVTHRESEPGRIVGHDALPVDIVSELWFDTEPALQEAAPHGRLGEALRSTAARAGVYQVQTYVIV